jgi:hypothetical protein
MKKIIIILFLFLFSNTSYANDSRINEFTKWLLDNGHTQYLKKNECSGCDFGTNSKKHSKDGEPKKKCWMHGKWKK